MFRYRRFPLIGWLLVAWLVFALAQSSGAGAAASFVGFALLLPLFLMKMFFLFMVIGFVMHKVGGGHWHDHPRHRGHPRRRGHEDEPVERRDPEWERNVRDARDELDEMFPDDPTSRFPGGTTATS